VVLGWGGGAQQKGKGGVGGGPTGKAAAAGSSSGEASTSRGEASRPSTLSSGGASLRSTVVDAAQPALPSAEVASGAQQKDPQPQPAAGISKKDKERLRKERQTQRKAEEARTALDAALDRMVTEGEACAQPRTWRSSESALDVAEQATRTAERYQAHSETLAALVASAKQARRRLSRRERRRRSE
jgi:hypothetical protein